MLASCTKDLNQTPNNATTATTFIFNKHTKQPITFIRPETITSSAHVRIQQ